jgi:hypothetical protein
MAAPIVGGHPFHPRPPRACGSFSFKGNDKDFYFIWTVPGGMIAAWARSYFHNNAIITFHPAAIIVQNNVPQYQVWHHIVMAAVPPLNMFRIQRDAHVVAPTNIFSYQIPLSPSYTFSIFDQPWEQWESQHQMWRQALTGNVADHNWA